MESKAIYTEEPAIQLNNAYINGYTERLINTEFIPDEFLCFSDPHPIKHWAEMFYVYFENLEQLYDNRFMDYEDATELYSYIKAYCGWIYININEYFRKNPYYPSLIKRFLNIAHALDTEIKRFAFIQHTVVVRRMRNDFLFDFLLKGENLEVDKTLSDPAYISCSLNMYHRKIPGESEDQLLNNETLLFIKLKKGTNYIYLEPFSNREEYEVLLGRNTKLTIESFKRIGNCNILICNNY